MKRIARIFRIIPLSFLCAVFLYAALQVQRDRANGSLIGAAHEQPSFLAQTFREMNNMWTAAFILMGAGPATLATPAPAPAQATGATSSLDALKTRTRNLAQGFNADGSLKF